MIRILHTASSSSMTLNLNFGRAGRLELLDAEARVLAAKPSPTSNPKTWPVDFPYRLL